MDEKEILKEKIENLTKSHNYIEKALNELREVEDYSDDDFDELCKMSETINDLRIKKESEWSVKYE